ncbi:MAG: type I DNA topoisomerase [Pseudoflavonifractor sp.]|nr:type I DNA topoisomerase [Alloprevotella sp.]MCM1116253.1 type I DNA topoisomerase [Pseudoflavonifractor sp.]
MAKNLVIVESPAKAKTIEKFLGPDYRVMSSYGHIRDLAKKDFDITPEADFTPVYEIPEDKMAHVEKLREAAEKAQTVWLASDEDREGEAIAWHLAIVLGLDPEKAKRIVFHEITKKAILNALANPRHIDLRRVDAQQARRVLDRIVGFELSPVLWRKIRPALSAGRVQSVAVRLIVEREEEIKAFKSTPYFRITAGMATTDGSPFHATLSERLSDGKAAEALIEKWRDATWSVADIQVKPFRKSPAPPFTTSTLQQEAARKLGFSVGQTMRVAQMLYEAGHITYMRTDSLNLSEEAIKAIAAVITAAAGSDYLHERRYHTDSKGAQEAHEAIRPTNIASRQLTGVSSQEARLYDLIWKRAVASQMADAHIEKTTVEIASSTPSTPSLTASGEVIKYDGFLRLYIEGSDDEQTETESGDSRLPALAVGESVTPIEITATERYTQHPPRYTEASLVKKMEELGIGRPSTYAPTISTIQQREYAQKSNLPGEKRDTLIIKLDCASGELTRSTRTEVAGADKGKLMPTDTGSIVNSFLTEYFPNILDYNFTARVEERFDEIASGNTPWKSEISDFYEVFHPEVVKAVDTRFDHRPGERELGVDPASGRPVSVKIGRFGPVVQIGLSTDDEKPLFASLQPSQSVFDITLEEALKLFELPRELGEYEGTPVTASVGKFGPYIRYNKNKFVSLPADITPQEVTLTQAIELIEEKKQADAKNVLKTYDEEPDLTVLKGRYGPYIVYKGKNYKLPKAVATDEKAIEALNIEDCRKLIEEAEASAPAKPRSRRFTSRTKKS